MSSLQSADQNTAWESIPSQTAPGKRDYLAVLRNGKMLGIITEFAYLDSEDYKAIDTDKELDKEAICIFNGTNKFNK